MGVMDAVPCLIKGDKNKGNKNTTKLINNTDEVMEIREFDGIISGKNNLISAITVKARQHIDIVSIKYGGDDSRGGQPCSLKIFCNGSYLRSSKGVDLLLSGEQFISFKSITIDPPEGQNSTGVVNYEVKFQQRDASVRDNSLKVFRDLVLDHDNGWSMQHCENGSVKLTYRKGMTMTLDPSKLFATVVDPAETSLLRMVLKFWSRTFADLNCKDNLGRTVCVVNDLMCQAKSYNDDRSKVEVAKVVEKVRVLNELCAAKVEWYHPLFPGMEDRFPPVVEMMAEVDQEKLKKFAATIKPLLQPPNSLRYLMIFRDGSLLRLSEQDLLLRGEEFISFKTVTIDQPEDQNSTGVVNYEVKFQQRDASVRDNSLKKWATRKGYSLGEERPFEVRRLSMDEKFDPRLQLIHMSQFARSSPRALALSDGGEIVRPTALSSSEFAATNNKAHLVGQDQSGSAASHYRCKNTRETSDKQGLEVLQQHFGCKHKHALKSLGVSGSMFKSTCRQHWFYWWQGRFENNDSLAWKSFEVLDSLPLGEQSNSIRHLARRRTLTHKHCVRLNKSQELPRSMLRDYSGGLAAQFDIGLPDGGHILSLSEKKIVRKTLKRKCRTMSVLSLEDHQQHVGRRWEDTVKFLGAKRIYRQLGIHRETTAKRIRGQLGTRWSFKQFAIPILQTAIGLPDGGHILSLSEKKIVRKTSTRKCRSMSVLSLEDHKQHVDRRWEDVVKSHGAKRICRQLVIHRLSTAKRIHKQHGIHWWPFQRSAVGLPNGGHILPLSEKKIVGKTLKRKCRSTSVLSLVDRQQHVDRRWEDAAKNIGAKRICRQLVIHHVSIAKRRQHGIHHRWPFQQDWATMKGYSLGDGRPVEVIRLSTHAKLVSRLQLIYISWLGRFSPRPSALAGGGEVGRPLALSLSESAATKNIAQRVGQGQSGSAASDYENERTREQEDLEEIHASSTSDDLRQLFRRMNRKDAAARLGVSESTFKRRCRKCGIKRWPEVRKRKVGRPPDQHGDGNTSTARNTPSQYVQTRMGGELVGQNHEANVFRDFTEGPPALNTENGLKGSSSEWASQMKDQSTLSTPYPNHNALVFPQPHSMLSEDWGGLIDWWNSFASQAEPFSDRHISGSSNLAFPTWSDQAAPSQHVEGQSMQSTVYPDHNAVHRFPEGHVCESVNWNEHTNSLASQIPNPNVVPLEPQIASTQMLSENMGSLDNWAELVSLEEEPSLGGHVSGSANLTVTTCCDPSPSQQPMPTNHNMMPTAHVMSHLVARKDLSSVTLKVSYGDKTIKFQVPLTSKIVEVKEEVKKRLKLEPSNFDFEYKDEDDGDWIFLGCDEDLTNHLQLFSNQVIRLLVVDSDASTKNICESCGSLKRKRQ